MLGFAEVMLAGLARDGGLYVPDAWPQIDAGAIAGFAGRPYAEVALEVIRLFTGDSIGEAELARMAREAYGTFRHPAVVPLTQLGVNMFALELFHGPTLAFKDVAMQLLARLMDHALAARGERRTIVVATSGDTGGAAVEAFRDRNQVDLIVLFPNGRVSDVQRRMMTTADAANIHALAIEGTFDDCQAMVKGMFNHAAFRDRVRLSGVNSINWARIVAQTVYYFAAAVSLGDFGATAFIARPDTPTVPVAIFRWLSLPGQLNFDRAMALSTVLMVLTGLVVVGLERLRVGSLTEF